MNKLFLIPRLGQKQWGVWLRRWTPPRSLLQATPGVQYLRPGSCQLGCFISSDVAPWVALEFMPRQKESFSKRFVETLSQGLTNNLCLLPVSCYKSRIVIYILPTTHTSLFFCVIFSTSSLDYFQILVSVLLSFICFVLLLWFGGTFPSQEWDDLFSHESPPS